MNYLTRTTCFRGVHGLIIVPFYDILTAQTFECVAQFCKWIPIYWGNVPSVYRGGSSGRVPRVRTPPEMTCSSLIQLVFCQKKNYVVYWCWSRAREECTPPGKNSGSALGLIETADFIRVQELMADPLRYQAQDRAHPTHVGELRTTPPYRAGPLVHIVQFLIPLPLFQNWALTGKKWPWSK